MIGNNALLEATVYITDSKAFFVWFLINGIVITNECLFVGDCGSLGCLSSEIRKDVTLLC